MGFGDSLGIIFPFTCGKPLVKGNISEEIRDLTAKDFGQKLGTLGRLMGHWADIKNK